MRGIFRIEVQQNQLIVLLNTARLNLDSGQLVFLGQGLRDAAARVQARAVRNLSGYPVQYDGRVFRVMVRTGALRGAVDMQWPYQSALQARVFINGTHTAMPMQMGDMVVKARPVSEYAAAIEFGHKEIDLKVTMLGKIVPFFAARSKSARGPFAAAGLVQIGGSEMWESPQLNARLAAKGKGPMHFARKQTKAAYQGASRGGGSYYIAFRRVGKTGWIIPEAAPRPFMRAATWQSRDDTRALMYQRLRDLLTPQP